MTDRHNIKPSKPILTGRRRLEEFDASPRDKTVCFTVSAEEKDAIDLLASCLGRTRSSLLTRIVTSFVEDCMQQTTPDQVISLFDEFRDGIAKTNFPINRP